LILVDSITSTDELVLVISLSSDSKGSISWFVNDELLTFTYTFNSTFEMSVISISLLLMILVTTLELSDSMIASDLTGDASLNDQSSSSKSLIILLFVTISSTLIESMILVESSTLSDELISLISSLIESKGSISSVVIDRALTFTSTFNSFVDMLLLLEVVAIISILLLQVTLVDILDSSDVMGVSDFTTAASLNDQSSSKLLIILLFVTVSISLMESLILVDSSTSTDELISLSIESKGSINSVVNDEVLTFTSTFTSTFNLLSLDDAISVIPLL